MSLSMALHAVGVQRGRKWVLRELTLELRAGERWALIGANGAGKTQLLKLLAGDVWPTPTGRERRAYRSGGREVELIEAKQRIAYLGAETQDKYSRYGWNPTVFDLIATGLHRTDLLLGAVSADQRRVIAATLRECGLTPLAQRRLASLSYGQKRLALLARALVRRPDWLLLDELYNGLDTTCRERIDRVLDRVRSRGGSWIVAAHRASDVPRGTRGIIELEAGRLAAMRPLRRAALERLRAAAREPVAPSGTPARGARGPGARRQAAPLLAIEGADLYVEYRPVLRGLSWALREGEHWAVLGANGAGKSSFLKLLYGDLSPALGGVIERRGFARGTPLADWKRRVGYVSPELQTDCASEWARELTLLELVASGRYASIGLAHAPTARDLRVARHWLGFFELAGAARRRARELSYGQLRRALLARALAAQPRILLLDEPLTGLDPRQRALIKRLLQRLMRSRVALIIAVHHPEDLPRGMTHGLILRGGRAQGLSFR